MSVAIEDTLVAHGDPPESVLAGYADDVCLVAFKTAIARSVEQAVCRDPKESEPAHGLVVGKKSEGRQRILGRASSWVVPPPDACDPPMV